MNLTKFLKLKKPVSTDRYDINIFNSNSDIIDSELSKLDESNKHTEQQVIAMNTLINNNHNGLIHKIDQHANDNIIHITATEHQKLSSIEAGAQVNTLTGIKGNAETSFRHGNVNLTPANIGADVSGSSAKALLDAKKYTDDIAVKKNSIDMPNGVAPLNEHRKIPSANIPFGTTPGTCFDGATGQKLINDFESHSSASSTSFDNLSKSIADEATRATRAENVIESNLIKEISRATIAEESISQIINVNKPSWDDKYTKNEVDNKFSAMETNIDWKESVNTFSNIASTYPKPQDGWTVNVKDTDYTYRWNGNAWIAISANSIPKATATVDGLLAKEDKAQYDDANSKKHTHPNKSILDAVTQAIVNGWNSAVTHISDAVKHITAAERTTWNTVTNKVDKAAGKGLSTNDYTTTEKNKLAGIAAGAEANVQPDWNVADTASDAHIKNKPASMPASDVPAWAKAAAKPSYSWSEIASRPTKVSQFTNDTGYITSADVDTSQNHTHSNKPVLDKITQALLDTWNTVTNKVDKVAGKGLSSNDYTTAEKTKLSSIASGANSYVHPTNSGNKHIPTGGTTGQILRWSADGTAVWGADNNTTYGNASTSVSGLMSNTDKTKIDGIATGATKNTILSITVTLATSGWNSSNTQTITIAGITASNNGILGIDDSATDAQRTAASNAFIQKTAQGTNTITVKYMGIKPTVNIPIRVIIFA